MMRVIPSDSESHERDAFDLAAGYRCPPPETLLPAIEGTLPEPLRAQTLAHLDRCDVCRNLVTALESPEVANHSDLEAARIRARIDQRVIEQKTVSRRPWLAGLATAAAIIITVGMVWMVRVPTLSDVPDAPSRPATPPTQEARTFVLPLTVPPIELPPGALVLRGGAADSQAAALASALEPFGRGDYEDAARRLEAIRQAPPDDAFASYYLGVSYLLAGRLADASLPLQRARELSAPGTAMHGDATWYLAIVLERSDRVGQVAPLLKQLCGSGGSHDAPACAALVALAPRIGGNNRDAASTLLSLAGVGVGGQRAGVGRATD